MKTPKKEMVLPPWRRDPPPLYLGQAAKFSATDKHIIENTPCLKALYQFLEDGTTKPPISRVLPRRR